MMKKKLITILLIHIVSCNISGQAIYFNDHFSYNGKFTIAGSIFQSGNNYTIIGACVNTISPTRAIGIWTLNNNGLSQSTKVLGNSNYELYCGHYGASHQCINSDFSLAGSLDYPSIDSAVGILYRFNQNGDTLWSKEYINSFGTGISDWAIFYNHIETADQGFLLLGIIRLPGSYNQGVMVVRTDSMGNELWRKIISTYNRMDIAYNIINTPDSGFVIGAYQYLAGDFFSGDARVYKLDKLGNLEWTRTYGSPWPDGAARVILTRDTNILVVYGEAYMLDEPGDPATALPEVAIVKVSLSGQILWKKSYRQYHTSIPNVVTLGHDGYVIAGQTNLHDTINNYGGWMGFVLKINENGDSIWWRNHWNQPIMQNLYEQNSLYDITATSDGGYIACGETSSALTAGTLGYQHGWVLKMDEFGCQNAWCTSGIQELEIKNEKLEIFPNPFGEELHVVLPEEFFGGMLVMYDVQGRRAVETFVPKGYTQQTFTVQTPDLKPGMYLVEVTGKDGRVWRRKMVKKG